MTMWFSYSLSTYHDFHLLTVRSGLCGLKCRALVIERSRNNSSGLWCDKIADQAAPQGSSWSCNPMTCLLLPVCWNRRPCTWQQWKREDTAQRKIWPFTSETVNGTAVQLQWTLGVSVCVYILYETGAFSNLMRWIFNIFYNIVKILIV